MEANCDNNITSDSRDEMKTLNDWLSIKRKLLTNYLSNYSKEQFSCEVITKLATDKMTTDSAADEGVMGVSSSAGEGAVKRLECSSHTTQKKRGKQHSFWKQPSSET